MHIKDKITLTLAQVDLYWEEPERNRASITSKIERAQPSDIIILPETFTSGFSMKGVQLAETMQGPTVQWMLELAEKFNIAICGSLIIKENGHFFNRFIFAKPDGEVVHYDKRHLFSIGGEKDAFTRGSSKKIFSYLGWRIGLYICYDLRFPVWCRNRNDTDLMVFTSNWPSSRRLIWNTLLKARAIENQVYVAGVNRIGNDGNGIQYSGESQLTNWNGISIPEPKLKVEGLFNCEVSLNELKDFRKKFPFGDDADLFEIR